MESKEDYLERYLPFIKQNLLVLIFGISGLMFLGYGLIQFLHQKSDSEGIVLEKAEAPVEDTAIMVDVAGAVVRPGVYKVSTDGRIQDALISAGGLSDDADREWVARVINLAAKVSDGTKLYIPFKGDPAAPDASQNKQININTAKQSELESLSGIGPATAQKIIDGRPYSAVEDLLNKKVVSKSVFEKIKDKVAV